VLASEGKGIRGKGISLETVLASFLSLHGLAVGMRLLGLLYYTNRERFAWFQ
jgi:hypothetical protein